MREQPAGSLLAQLRERASLSECPSLREVVTAVQALPYGRPSGRTASAVLKSGRGTCSTKHYLLVGLIGESWPALDVEIVHRVYQRSREAAELTVGLIARSVPPTANGRSVDLTTHLRP